MPSIASKSSWMGLRRVSVTPDPLISDWNLGFTKCTSWKLVLSCDSTLIISLIIIVDGTVISFWDSDEGRWTWGNDFAKIASLIIGYFLRTRYRSLSLDMFVGDDVFRKLKASVQYVSLILSWWRIDLLESLDLTPDSFNLVIVSRFSINNICKLLPEAISVFNGIVNSLVSSLYASNFFLGSSFDHFISNIYMFDVSFLHNFPLLRMNSGYTDVSIGITWTIYCYYGQSCLVFTVVCCIEPSVIILLIFSWWYYPGRKIWWWWHHGASRFVYGRSLCYCFWCLNSWSFSKKNRHL